MANIVERATSEYQASRQINTLLITIMMVQGNDLPSEEERENVIKHQKKEKFVALKKTKLTLSKSQYQKIRYFIRRNFRERNFRESKNSRIFLDKLSRFDKSKKFREINFREWRN